MKNAFVLASLVLVLAFALAAIAQFAGFISVSLFSLPVVVGWSTISGVLAIAIADYTQKRTPVLPRATRPTVHASRARRTPTPASGTAWAYRTISA